MQIWLGSRFVLRLILPAYECAMLTTTSTSNSVPPPPPSPPLSLSLFLRLLFLSLGQIHPHWNRFFFFFLFFSPGFWFSSPWTFPPLGQLTRAILALTCRSRPPPSVDLSPTLCRLSSAPTRPPHISSRAHPS
ncbi:hypothetical protein LZ32DRAFT_6145 [Colletotrichum eremochloae]|nr:hypothetical protein LZ32DRAFT_6145 [Colletotrichum eremochloae]